MREGTASGRRPGETREIVLRLLVLCAAALPLGARTAAAQDLPAVHGLAKHDHTRLVELRVAGNPDAPVLIATAPGTSGAAAKAVEEAGGFVVYRADPVGYLRAVVPLAKVEPLAALPEVEALNIDTGQFYFSAETSPPKTPAETAPQGGSVSAPGPGTPPENGYLAAKDVGAPSFLRSHPDFDGRGVTIAIIECCPDSLHPAVREAKDASGHPVRKIVRMLAAGDFEKLGWNMPMHDEVDVHGRRFLYRGGIYTAPQDGRYRIGVKSADDVNLYFAPRHPPPIAVLWEVASGTFWIDTNNDHSFADETPVHEFNRSGEAVPLRWDEETAKANYLTGSLAVLIDPKSGGILLAPSGMHATAVSGGAAGHSLYGGTATGSAPGARIVSVWTGLTTGGAIEAFLAAAQQPDVDVISSQNAYEMRLRDGHSVWSIVQDRLVGTYHKIIFAAAGNNGPGVASTNEAASASEIVKVGGYVGRETWLTNFGLVGDRDGYVGFSSTRGPRADGGELPQMIAPICSVAPSGIGAKNVENDGMWSGKALYTNPTGYESNCGTSFATPMTAGAAAALISAARSSGVACDPQRLRWAMAAGARFLSGFQAYEQGAGLVNIPAAWERLRAAPSPVTIRSWAPVRTSLSASLRTPHRGTGLYEREGWVAGQTGERTVTFLRSSGPSQTVAYRLEWLGNDGTFSSPSTVRLPLARSVELKVKVAPRTSGIHSAILRVMNVDGLTPTHEMLATVIAAERFGPGNGYSISREGQVPWLGTRSWFVEVPKGAGSLNIDVKAPAGPVRLFVYDPAGERYPAAFAKLFVPPEVVRGQTSWNTSGELRRSIPRPEPGVWEVILEHNGYSRVAERFAPQKDALVTVSFSVAAIASAGGTAAPCGAGQAPCSFSLRTSLAGFEGKASGVGIASVSRETISLTGAERGAERKIKVEEGATRLSVRMRSLDPSADVDLHLFDCTQGSCERRESVVFRSEEKELTVSNPKAGDWKAVVEAHALPSGGAQVEYADAVVAPKYGELKISDPAAHHAPGSTWTVSATAVPTEAVPEKRSPMAAVEVVSDSPQTPVGSFWGQPGPDIPLGPSVFGTVWLPLAPSKKPSL